MKLVNLLASKNFTIYNKVIAKKFGCPLTAVILSQLCSMNDNLSDSKGWFFCTADTMENETAINSYKQGKCYSKLEEAGVIETKLMGLPAKKYFRILDLNKLFENEDSSNEVTTKQVSQKLENLSLKTAKQDVQKLDTINITNQYNNKHNINNKLFDIFWNNYPNKIGKAEAQKKFNKLSDTNKQLAIESAKAYSNYSEFEGYKHCHATTFINQQRYLEDYSQLQKTVKTEPEEPKSIYRDANEVYRERMTRLGK